jgi:tRNA pseudouridine13 synthase
LLQVERHSRKLKRGALRGNRFRLRIRRLQGDRQTLEARLQALAAGGVPNYFGEQRFGRDGDNVEMARRLFAGELKGIDRHRRGLYLSAARSHLFNRVLAQRVARGDWNQAIPGDAMMLDGRSATFRTTEPDPEIRQRVAAQEIHPTGPLWGRGDPMTELAALELEQGVAAQHPDLAAGLLQHGLEQERRALRLRVQDLQWGWPEDGQLEIAFQLPAGGYATTVLRELVAEGA